MKRICLLLLLLLLAVFTSVPVCADADLSPEEEAAAALPEDPEELLRVVDGDYFPRVGFSQSFWETQGYVNEILDGGIIHQYFVRDGKGSDLLMSMFPAETYARTGNHRLHMDRALMDNYHMSITVRRAEDLPAGAGGCWLRYSNVLTKSSGRESGLILFPGKQAFGITPSSESRTVIWTEVADLSALDPAEEIRFDFIRIGSVSYIYADGKFLFEYDDGYDGKMSLEGGAEIYEGGNRVRCDFDDFTMWYR